jgi:hypothetical protein
MTARLHEEEFGRGVRWRSWADVLGIDLWPSLMQITASGHEAAYISGIIVIEDNSIRTLALPLEVQRRYYKRSGKIFVTTTVVQEH